MDPEVAVGGGLAIFGGLLMLVWFAVVALMLASLWKTFAKAGEPGWAGIVPIYNLVVLMKIVGRPTWWFILFFVPLVNIVVIFLVYMDLAKSFGKGTGFALGLIFLAPIFWPMLGFGSARYLGPAATASPAMATA